MRYEFYTKTLSGLQALRGASGKEGTGLTLCSVTLSMPCTSVCNSVLPLPFLLHRLDVKTKGVLELNYKDQGASWMSGPLFGAEGG